VHAQREVIGNLPGDGQQHCLGMPGARGAGVSGKRNRLCHEGSRFCLCRCNNGARDKRLSLPAAQAEKTTAPRRIKKPLSDATNRQTTCGQAVET